MPAQTSIPKLFDDYYAIHATIRALLSASNSSAVDVEQVAMQVREAHPDLGMLPATLRAAIKQAIRSRGAQQQR
jgi:hypothetical protein